MTEAFPSQDHLSELRLAWDMAHAEAPLRNHIYRRQQGTHEQRFWPGRQTIQELAKEAQKKSSEVEKVFYERLAQQDEDYLAMDALYKDIRLNKKDFHEFLSKDAKNEKELKVANQSVSQIWNMLGELSHRPNADILFGETKPTGKQKHGYQKGRNRVGSEIVEYIDLDFASLVHFLDVIEESSQREREWRALGIGRFSLKMLTDFADFETQELVNARQKQYPRVQSRKL